MESVPDYEVRHGQMHIRMGGLDLVMPVHVFLEGMAKGEAAIAKWHLRELATRESNVVELPFTHQAARSRGDVHGSTAS